MFPKLRLKYKPNLISLAGGLAGLPVTRPEARATPVNPQQWKQLAALAQVRRRAGAFAAQVVQQLFLPVVLRHDSDSKGRMVPGSCNSRLPCTADAASLLGLCG